MCDLADAAMGMAFVSTLGPEESFTTTTLSINCFRPVWQSALRAEARVINRGKNMGYVECDITDREGKRIAKANSTCVVLRGAGERTLSLISAAAARAELAADIHVKLDWL